MSGAAASGFPMSGAGPSGIANTQGASELFLAIAGTVREMVGAKDLCRKLVEDLREVDAQVERLRNHKQILAVTALESFTKLLEEVQEFLGKHANSHMLKRIANHWKMKEVIKEFYINLNTIRLLVELQFREQDADNVDRIISTQETGVDRMMQRLNDIEQSSRKDFAQQIGELQTQISKQLISDLREEGFATLADLKNECKNNRGQYTQAQLATMDAVLTVAGKLVPKVEIWYVPRGEIKFETQFDASAQVSLHHGRLLYSGTKVTISRVNAEASNLQLRTQFVEQVRKWYVLSDPHVLPLYGANDAEKPYLIICGRATNGNFNAYLKEHPERFWRVFLDAARGLAYLHKHNIVHSNLKCNNLLVSEHGVGMVSDFAFAFVRADSTISSKPQVNTFHWKAPECFDPCNRNPRFESDVYSLGMCMFEACTGAPAYADVKQPMEAIEKIVDGKLPDLSSVPKDVRDLILKMCALNYQDRSRLSDIITTIAGLAKQEALAHPHCDGCGRHIEPETEASVISQIDSMTLDPRSPYPAQYQREYFA